MGAVYRWLMSLYSPEFRREFGDEMEWVFAEAEAAAARLGMVFRCRFYAREIVGMLGGALVEQWGSADSLKFFSRRFAVITRNNRFRFPLSGIAFMTLSLGLVVWAIQKAQHISYALAGKGYYEPADFGFLLSFGVILALTLAVTAAVCVVRHKTHRSGVHRLSDAQTWPQS